MKRDWVLCFSYRVKFTTRYNYFKVKGKAIYYYLIYSWIESARAKREVFLECFISGEIWVGLKYLFEVLYWKVKSFGYSCPYPKTGVCQFPLITIYCKAHLYKDKFFHTILVKFFTTLFFVYFASVNCFFLLHEMQYTHLNNINATNKY